MQVSYGCKTCSGHPTRHTNCDPANYDTTVGRVLHVARVISISPLSISVVVVKIRYPVARNGFPDPYC